MANKTFVFSKRLFNNYMRKHGICEANLPPDMAVVSIGELTFTPATGFIRWTDPTIDKLFGEKIKL